MVLVILMVVVAIISLLTKKPVNNRTYGKQWTYDSQEEGTYEYYNCADEQYYNTRGTEGIENISVILEVTDTSEITSFRKAQIYMSRDVFECIDESYEYYRTICRGVSIESLKWRQDKMVEMVSRLMVVDLTIEEYVMACFTSVALAAAMGQNGQLNSQKLKNVSVNNIMNFDYLYMNYTSIWLKFNIILLCKDSYKMLSEKCAVLAQSIAAIHDNNCIEKLSWDWEVNRGINTNDMERWVKNSCKSLNGQHKTSVLIGDQRWWETEGVADLRCDKNMDGVQMLSADPVGCNHVDYMLIMGKAQVLDKKMLIMFGCRKCVTAEITDEMEKNQDRIWIIL